MEARPLKLEVTRRVGDQVTASKTITDLATVEAFIKLVAVFAPPRSLLTRSVNFAPGVEVIEVQLPAGVDWGVFRQTQGKVELWGGNNLRDATVAGTHLAFFPDPATGKEIVNAIKA